MRMRGAASLPDAAARAQRGTCTGTSRRCGRRSSAALAKAFDTGVRAALDLGGLVGGGLRAARPARRRAAAAVLVSRPAHGGAHGDGDRARRRRRRAVRPHGDPVPRRSTRCRRSSPTSRDEPGLVWETATRLLIAEYFLYRLSRRDGGRGDDGEHDAARRRAHRRVGASICIAAIGDDAAALAAHRSAGHRARPAAPRARAGRRRSRRRRCWRRCAHDTAAAVAAVPATRRARRGRSSARAPGRSSARSSTRRCSTPRRASRLHERGRDSTAPCAFSRTARGCGCSRSAAANGSEQGDAVLARDALREAAAESASLGVVDRPQRAGVRRARRHGREARRDACAARGMRCADDARRRRAADPRERSPRATPPRSTSSRRDRNARRRRARRRRRRAQRRCSTSSPPTARGRRVLAGPEEATVLGNLLVQARALGDLPAGVTVRDAARRSSQHHRISLTARCAPPQRSLLSLSDTRFR